tara:strand:+ start:53 stop:418 length:366 start_codon:yes stop_codon:yes gene_type:complete
MRLLCPYCGNNAELCKGDKVYPKRTDLHKLNFWRCDPCGAKVGTHKGTTNPLGRLANTQLRYWKIKAHSAFDPKWRNGDLKRGSAYKWLAGKMDMRERDCHIGMFDVSQCKKVVAICSTNK